MKTKRKNKSTKGNNIKREEQLRTEIGKKNMIDALELSKGIVTSAAKHIGIDRGTHYKWYDSDSEYKKMVDDIENIALDFSESKLMEKINGIKVKGEKDIYKIPPSDAAIIFHLKTKGKRRGYVEKSEVDMTIAVPQLVYKYDDESQRKLLEENE